LDILSQLGGDAFYRRPSAKGKTCCVQPVGVNKLGTIIKRMCKEAGLDSYFSNHSGKRTCATVLYQAGVPEQEIMARTGHHSVVSVRKYKRPSTEMLKDISNILEPAQGLEGVAKKIKRETDAGSLEKIKPESQSGCSTSSSKDIVFNGCVLNFSPGSNLGMKEN
jgi:hypothetical protein